MRKPALTGILIVAALLVVFGNRIPMPGQGVDDGAISSTIEADAEKFVRYYAENLETVYEKVAGQCDQFNDLGELNNKLGPYLKEGREKAFTDTIAKHLVALNGSKWDRDRARQTMDQIADGIGRHK